MTSTDSPALAGEALCAKCVQAGGLCRSEQCQRQVLPQLKEPSWPSMIGEGYVCQREECVGHMTCSAVFLEPAPRAGCGCHACGQRRVAIKHELLRAHQELEEHAAIEKIRRRNERKAGKRPRLTGTSRLLHHMNGGYDRKRPGAAA